MSNETGLKPCPLCGGKNIKICHGMGDIWVRCIDCDCSGNMSSNEKSVIKKWNTRPQEDFLVNQGRKLIVEKMVLTEERDRYKLALLEVKEFETKFAKIGNNLKGQCGRLPPISIINTALKD